MPIEKSSFYIRKLDMVIKGVVRPYLGQLVINRAKSYELFEIIFWVVLKAR